MNYRIAALEDLNLLGLWNRQLIEDQRSRNSMNQEQLVERMEALLAEGYTAIIFSKNAKDVAYALFRESESEVYLRQFFVCRDSRRKGYGTQVVGLLLEHIWSAEKRLTVDALSGNAPALAFWRSLGFCDYSVCLELLRG